MFSCNERGRENKRGKEGGWEEWKELQKQVGKALAVHLTKPLIEENVKQIQSGNFVPTLQMA